MTIGRFELKLNSKTLVMAEEHTKDCLPTNSFPWVTLALRIPAITLPFYRRNDWGEWERIFAISAPTLVQFTNCSDISWEGHLMVLGFGISFIYQSGY
jgi:hypothetical protein